MWNKVYDSVYVLRSYNDIDGFTALEGVFVDMDSCIENVIEILRAKYTAGEGDFPEDKIRREIINEFDNYNGYWNEYADITFNVETSNVWKYERGC